MATGKITDLTSLPTANRATNVLEVVDVGGNASYKVTPNFLLGLSGNPVGDTDSQTLTNKILTGPTISGPVLSGTVTGTYTLGGTPTFPASVVTLTGSQTLTNKVLTSPTISSPTITNASITADAVTGFTVANNGTIYGVGVTAGVITTASVGTSSIVTGAQFVQKTQNPYKFHAYRSAALTPAGTGAIVFDAKVYDTGSNFNTTTGLFTAPIAGFYFLTASLTFVFNAASVANGLALNKNNGTNIGSSSHVVTYAGTFNDTAAANGVFQLAANDTVQVNNIANPGKALVTGSDSTYFSGFLVSQT